MAFNLRLPAALESDARERCERVGISLNSLVCVALDAYLRGPTASNPGPAREIEAFAPQSPEPKSAPAQAVPEPSSGSQKLAALRAPKPKPVLTAEPLQPVRPTGPPKPVLGPNPSKADRQRLAKWYRDNPQS